MATSGKGRTPVNFKQLGVSGLRRTGPYIYEEFLPELRYPQAARVYQEMSDNDPVIGSILYLAEMLIRGATWDVEPASDSAADKEAAEFLKQCMNDMDMSWANTICEILSMLTYGFSFHEIVYKIRRGPTETNGKFRSAYTDGRIGWRRLPIRSQGSLYQWEFDESGDVTAFVQLAEPDYKLTSIPISKGLLFRTRISRDNPEGKSLLRNAYRPWFFKKHFEEIEGIGIERDLAGFPILQTPEGVDIWDDTNPDMMKLRANAETIVASVRRDSEEGLLLPFGWELKLLTSGSSRQIDIGSTIERYDNRIAITMLSDIILIGNNKNGSFALADTKQSILSAALQAQLSNISDVFNAKAVPDLFQHNAGSFEGISGMPKITVSQIRTPSISEVSLMLRAMGLNIAGDKELQKYLRKTICAPDLDEETFEAVYKEQMKKDEPAPVEGAPDEQSNNPKDTKEDGKTEGKAGGATDSNFDDSAENAFEQNDMRTK